MEALHNLLKSIHEMQTTTNSFISFQFPIFFSWRTISLNSQPFLPNNISFVYPPNLSTLKHCTAQSLPNIFHGLLIKFS